MDLISADSPLTEWPATRQSHPFDGSWAEDIPLASRAALGGLLTTAGRSFSSLRSSSERSRDDSEPGVTARAEGAAEMAALASEVANASASVADRVAAGAALLDRKLPGWAERIDLAALSIASCTRCVLGQLAPDIDGCGFDPDFGFDAGDLDRSERVIARLSEYAALDAEWKRVITERLGDPR